MHIVTVYFSPLWGKVLCATHRQSTLVPSTLVLYGAKFCAQRTIFSFFAELVYLTRQGGKRGGVGWLMPVVLFLGRVACPLGQIMAEHNLVDCVFWCAFGGEKNKTREERGEIYNIVFLGGK